MAGKALTRFSHQEKWGKTAEIEVLPSRSSVLKVLVAPLPENLHFSSNVAGLCKAKRTKRGANGFEKYMIC
jgi:hypothetical protein